MAANNNTLGVDNTFRKKFDREEYLERAREREKQEAEGRNKSKAKGPPVQRKPLKHRDYEVDLESRLGKTQVVTPVAPLSQQAGYYCSVCECVVKDSANYLDHINGKKHQRALGMSMRVERASLKQVQERFEQLKKRKPPGSFTEQDLDERIIKQQEEEEERKRQRRERKKEKKKEKAAEEEPEIDPDVAAMMGFVIQAFGGRLICKVSRFRKDRKVKIAQHASFIFLIPSSVMEKLLNLSIYGCMVDLLARDNGL
ncbi:hypothetical protein CXB51_020456 [Gossypium anomalum]|uniref:U1-type domain-containing protein n=1 Tax=Gossypium anomalum TaxID=47600 RepID=A0A8J5YJS2_9ROSI|nr:hypothetical protein CXB51_020456 [Gossypium anomalum]